MSLLISRIGVITKSLLYISGKYVALELQNLLFPYFPPKKQILIDA